MLAFSHLNHHLSGPWSLASPGDLLLAFLRSREVDGPWRPRSDFIAGLSPILTATHLASEVDGLKRTLAGLSLVFPTTYLAHEVDGPWRPQGDSIAGFSPILHTTYLAHEGDGLERTLADLSLVLPTTYLAHEGDGLERTLADLSLALPTTYLAREGD